MKRLFVALEMPEVIRERLSEMLIGVPDACWVDPDNLHLTLRFIGEADTAMGEELAFSLSGLRVPSFGLSLDGLGIFESRGRLRALWVGVRGEPALEALQRKVVNSSHTLPWLGSRELQQPWRGPIWRHMPGSARTLFRWSPLRFSKAF
jgi:2'-5' RNA ligase